MPELDPQLWLALREFFTQPAVKASMVGMAFTALKILRSDKQGLKKWIEVPMIGMVVAVSVPSAVALGMNPALSSSLAVVASLWGVSEMENKVGSLIDVFAKRGGNGKK